SDNAVGCDKRDNVSFDCGPAAEGGNILFLPNEKAVSHRVGLSALTLALALSCAPALAQGVKLPSEAPLPELRPFLPTGTVSAAASSLFGNLLNPSSDHEHLRKGIEALTARDVEQARTARESLKKHSLDRQILTWAIALSNHPD